MDPCIDLSAKRAVAIKAGGRRYDYIFSPISERTWFAYFDAIVSSEERKGAEIISEFDTSKARLGLVSAVLESVIGYAIDGVADWREKLPLKHRLAASELLVRVLPREADAGELKLGEEAVMLTALWGADEQGNMLEYRNLLHRFETPTAEHLHRYRREMSRSTIVGGSRTGKTIWRGAQKTLAAIYDELIAGVDGYTWQGSPLEGRQQIAEHMDTFHKVQAAGQLFEPLALDQPEKDTTE